MSQFDLEMITCFVEEGLDLLGKWESACLALQKDPSPEVINDLFRVAHNLKGSSRSVGLETFGNFIHKVEDGIFLIKTGQVKVTSNLVVSFLGIQTLLSEWLTEIKKNPEFVAQTQVVLEQYQKALSGVETTPSGHSPVQAATTSDTPIQEAAPPIEPVAMPSAEGLNSSKPSGKVKAIQPTSNASDENIRVSARKIDQILELIGELSIHQAIVDHCRGDFAQASSDIHHATYLSRKLTKELYEKALSLRMYPLQPIFQRLERSIREIAITLDKDVEVTVVGGDVELDKTVCEKIVEPLTHMVRNAVDHGLELKEERGAAQKPQQGQIKIAAVQESGSVRIMIEDDGRGLSEEKILKKAQATGVWDGKANLKKEEIFALIFLPGFSTAEKVTNVSGRGVGMDVVMRTLESLSGKIQIASDYGKGTRFEISLPTTLSIIDGLIASVAGAEYVIPVADVDEVLNLSEWQDLIDHDKIKMGSSIIPLVPLSRYFPSPAKVTPIQPRSAIITSIGQSKVAMLVDQIGLPQQFVVKNLSGAMSNLFGVVGATILSNGRPGLILDLGSIAEAFFSKFRLEERRAA